MDHFDKMVDHHQDRELKEYLDRKNDIPEANINVNVYDDELDLLISLVEDEYARRDARSISTVFTNEALALLAKLEDVRDKNVNH
jgi:hypothetical protein